MLDLEHPFFVPLWRRVLIVVLTLGWAAFEFLVTAAPFWGMLFAAIGLYCAWTFFKGDYVARVEAKTKG